MSTATVEELQKDLIRYLEQVQSGNEVLICQRDVPIARLMPPPNRQRRIQCKAGWAGASLKVVGDITNACIPATDWDMLNDGSHHETAP
jgi:antitoxin (DNA-binding transcriptional repressor) of toxin-antitoxin stability system